MKKFHTRAKIPAEALDSLSCRKIFHCEVFAVCALKKDGKEPLLSKLILLGLLAFELRRSSFQGRGYKRELHPDVRAARQFGPRDP